MEAIEVSPQALPMQSSANRSVSGAVAKRTARRYTRSEKARAVEFAAAHGVSAASSALGMSRIAFYDWQKGVELAAAGYDVVFVEEGAHHDTDTFNPYMSESIPRLYRDGGVRSVTAHEREQRIAALVQQGQHQDDASDVEDVRGEIQKMNSPATSGTRH